MGKKWIFVLILLLFLVIFIAQNYEVVKIQLIFWSFQTSRAIVMFSALLIGIIIGWVISTIIRR